MAGGARASFFRTHRPQQVVAPAPEPWAPAVIKAHTPNHGGPNRNKWKGCVLHGTHGNGRTLEDEFRGTLSWFASQASEVSSTIVIAANGTIAKLVPSNYVTWHAGFLNSWYQGIEFVKRNPARFNDVVTEEQYKSAALWLVHQSRDYGYPLNKTTLPEHRETGQGMEIGKIDLGKGFDRARLMHWIERFKNG